MAKDEKIGDMKTFEEACKKIQETDMDKLEADVKCEWENLKENRNFKLIIRSQFDEIIIKLMQPTESPSAAILATLINTAQIFLRIGMEMEKFDE